MTIGDVLVKQRQYKVERIILARRAGLYKETIADAGNGKITLSQGDVARLDRVLREIIDEKSSQKEVTI